MEIRSISACRRPLAGAAIIAVFALAPCAWGQYLYQQDFDKHHSPFIEPDYFNPDYQFFAKAEIDEYGGFPEPNYGFFFSYERLYWNVSRSRFLEPQLRPRDGDFTWGNRIEGGYMDHNNKGWLLSAVHLDGPNVTQTIIPDPNVLDPTTLEPITNNIPVNIADLTVVELAKVWRGERLYWGGFFEYQLGIRYTKFQSFFDDVLFGPITFTFVDADGALQTVTSVFDLGDATVENNMFGGEIGMRWFKEKGRWQLSTDVKFIPSANFQIHDPRRRDPFTGEALPEQDVSSRSEFVPIGEIRASATYNVTRDVTIGVGFELMYMGQGVGRAFFNPPFEPVLNNDESLVISGASFQVRLNR